MPNSQYFLYAIGGFQFDTVINLNMGYYPTRQKYTDRNGVQLY